MMYLLDTAHLDDIRRQIDFFPICGVTTNPTLVSREHADFPSLIRSIRTVLGENRMLHVQTTAETADRMVKEALLLQEAVGKPFYLKIPISPEGLKATARLHKTGVGVTETAIFTPQQALLAAKAGADFVAPYVNRLDNLTTDGTGVVAEIVRLFEIYHLPCKVLAASFKNTRQIHQAALAGCHAVTIAPGLFDQLAGHPLTDAAVAQFQADWQSVYGKRTILDLLK